MQILLFSLALLFNLYKNQCWFLSSRKKSSSNIMHRENNLGSWLLSCEFYGYLCMYNLILTSVTQSKWKEERKISHCHCCVVFKNNNESLQSTNNAFCSYRYIIYLEVYIKLLLMLLLMRFCVDEYLSLHSFPGPFTRPHPGIWRIVFGRVSNYSFLL